MNRTDVMLAVVKTAELGGAVAPEEAISAVADLIDRQNMHRDFYERDVQLLLAIGATIWTMQQDKAKRGA